MNRLKHAGDDPAYSKFQEAEPFIDLSIIGRMTKLKVPRAKRVR